MGLLDRWRVRRIFRELERLGVRTHEGRIWTHDGADRSLGETLRRLRALPDGAGAAAVRHALSAPGAPGTRAANEATGPAGYGEMTDEVRLREVAPDDLPVFYEHQLDADAARMAAFPSRDRAAFDAHWATNILGDPAAVARTILVDGRVAGNIGSWTQDGVRHVGYWIGREHWGKGVATRALAAFLQVVTERPLQAHVAAHNVGSIRVLEKCGFILEREEHAEDVVELVLVLR